MDKKEKTVRLVDVGELESSLKKALPKKKLREKVQTFFFAKASRMSCKTLKIFQP